MNMRHLALVGLVSALPILPAYAEGPDEQAKLVDDARATVGQLVKTLGGELTKDMKEIGPEAAIAVCKDKAPKIAGAIAAEKGVNVRRVTFKNRNPKSVPDAWEAKVLKDFEQRLAAGASPATLDYSEVVTDGNAKTFRYMKALVIQEMCMTCHGTKETIPDAVKAKLAAEYPNDQATGYLPNMLRGAVSLKKAM